jgi:hypothetical protein
VTSDGRPVNVSSLPRDCVIEVRTLNDDIVNVTSGAYFSLNDTSDYSLDGGQNLTFNLMGEFFGRTHIEVTLKSGVNGMIYARGLFPVTVIRPVNTLNHFFMYSIIALVSMAYINMGSTLELEVVKKVVKKPVAPAVGLVCQYFYMPLV